MTTTGPFEETAVWKDSFEDMNNIYIPEGGLVGVEITDGYVELLPGYDRGWLASSIIVCPPGSHYDLVFLEVEMPGESYVEISVLNALQAASEIGFANETIPPYVKEKATTLSISNLSATMYPNIRIQVDLHAVGPDRPRLLSWSLYFEGLDEWHDDFIGISKMNELRGVNITEGTVEVNLSRISKGDDYKPFPPVVFAGPEGGYQIFYPTTDLNGYKDSATLSSGTTRSVAIADVDGDGYPDLIGCKGSGTSIATIYWGDASGTWTSNRERNLIATHAYRAGAGDFNGDGRCDIAIACWNGGGSANSVVYLNQGSGTFNNQPDISFVNREYSQVDTGDLNSDGYVDIAFRLSSTVDCYFGGPDGPNTSPGYSLTFTYCNKVYLHDINMDGYHDILISGAINGKMPIYMGGPSGPSTTADYSLSVPGSVQYSVAAGDINGDGYIDVLTYDGLSGIYTIHIFEGNAQGWTDSNVHASLSGDFTYTLESGDINKDGYDDIVISNRIQAVNTFRVLYGGETWPTTPSLAKPNADRWDVTIGITGGGGGGKYHGSFTTEPIVLRKPSEQTWDLLILEGKQPSNTTVTISVLDSRKEVIAGFEDRSEWVLDLSPITQETILVSIKISSEFNNTTPVLERLMVKWMDRMTWREQFYGETKIERLVNFVLDRGQLQNDSNSREWNQLLFPSLRGDDGYDTYSHLYLDNGNLDFLTRDPIVLKTKGVSSVDTADVNGDGFTDVAFSVYRTTDSKWTGLSPLYLGSYVGCKDLPDYEFPTVGARDILLHDLNNDGYFDVVYAQEQNGTTFRVNSTLFWGSASGWNSTPDVEFTTTGASSVKAEDLNSDGYVDLVFACYRDTSTTTNSMVFLQDRTGFCGTEPSHKLPTRGARAVAVGDLDNDGTMDLVFANHFMDGSVEIRSYVYWGKQSGGYEEEPLELPTVGAEDVLLADLDGDLDLDVVFANRVDNYEEYAVHSYVYLNDGSGGFPSEPSIRLPTVGASAVDVANLDNSGWLDLVFACQYNGSSYKVPSLVYLLTPPPPPPPPLWDQPRVPSLTFSTEGASDVIIARLMKAGSGGYLSEPIMPEDPIDTGSFHTLRYSAQLGPSVTGFMRLVDASTWEVLTEIPLKSGTHERIVEDAFRIKENPSVRVFVSVEGLDTGSDFSLDDLWLNWTKRVKRPPKVHGLRVSEPTVYRARTVTLTINVTDEFDLSQDLKVGIEYCLNGSGEWSSLLLGPPTFQDGTWTAPFTPHIDTELGMYDVRISATDSDTQISGLVEFYNVYQVLNNPPTTPEIQIVPARPVSTSTINVEVISPSSDVESLSLTYRFRWFCDGELMENLTGGGVPSDRITRGQNWSVEVRAFDGEEEGSPASAWRIIQNAPPVLVNPLPDPEIDEDVADSSWLNLSVAFLDPDGDLLSWSVDPVPQHLTVTIDPLTGMVTILSDKDWNGDAEVTFVASDGELKASQTVNVTVLPVNDPPRIVGIDGFAIHSEPVIYDISQGELLTLQVDVIDVEGDDLIFDANNTLVEVDSVTGELRFQPEMDAVGTMRFGLWVWDVVSPKVKVTLNFTINVDNVNDPMENPLITHPNNGDVFQVNYTFYLSATCKDPDIVHGQELNYTWTSNISGLLGYGRTLTLSIDEPGKHTIILTVNDGEFQKTTYIELVIKPQDVIVDPTDDDDDPEVETDASNGLIMGMLVLIVLAIITGYLIIKRREAGRKLELEVKDEEPGDAIDEREVLHRMATIARESAETLEDSEDELEGWVETGVEEGIEVDSVSIPSVQLSMKAKVSDDVPKDVQAFWVDVEDTTPSGEREKEKLRLDNLKRKYQNAISRLPYGIPSPELQEMDWTMLASALVSGPKKILPEGGEVTEIDGRWYYSDIEDASTFLREHGAKPKGKRKDEQVDKEVLLKKLEERFILGEISEETYTKLMKKYE